MKKIRPGIARFFLLQALVLRIFPKLLKVEDNGLQEVVSRRTTGGREPVYSELFWLVDVETMSSDKAFDDCVILPRGAFDPDAVFMDDIVDDDVLPNANLAVDGLTSARQARRGELELRSDDIAVNEPIEPDTEIPVITTEPHELDVYGFETSLWKKLRGYIGF